MDWPPPTRRSRTTRREQNLALLGAVASGAVIAVALVMLLLGRVNPEFGARVRGTAIDLVAPVWNVVRIPFDWIGSGIDFAGDYFGAVSRNRMVEAQLATQTKALEHQAVIARENAQLRTLLNVSEPDRKPIAVARIVGASSGGLVRTALVSAGSDDGVATGQPVRVAQGLVGRTLEAGSSATRILLLTDPGSRVPVIIERTGQSALAVGANTPLLEIRDRVGAEVALVAGDRLVTSGDGGVFAPGVPVAVVVDGKSEPPHARPMVNPAGLGLVRIDAPYLPLPAASLDTTSTVPVPREAGGGRAKPATLLATPRAVASAPSASTAPAAGPKVVIIPPKVQPAAPALQYNGKAMPSLTAPPVVDVPGANAGPVPQP
jgi:rod shape-determining protein MreC